MPARARNAVNKVKTLSEDKLSDLAPDTEETLLEDLSAATEDYGWGEVKGLNEKNLFDTQYNQIKQSIYREAGLTGLKLYDKYSDIVEAAALLMSGPDKADENFLGGRADSDQMLIRQIGTDTFGISPGDRVFSTGGTGAFDLVTRNTTTGNPYTLTEDEQMAVIFYYQSSLNPRVLESAQETVNDDIGDRQPFDVQSQLIRGNQGIITRPGVLIIEDSKDYELAGQALQNAETDLMPQGIEITIASAVTSIL